MRAFHDTRLLERLIAMSVNLSLFVDRGQTGNPPCRELSSWTEAPSNSTPSTPLTQSPGKILFGDFLRQFYITREVSSSPSTSHMKGSPDPRVTIGHTRDI